jgi:L-fuconolactonase
VTEADWRADPARASSLATLKPYLDAAVEAFGPKRLMAGSDWPVCLLATGYAQWFDLLRSYFAGFSEAERAAIFGGTAIEVYGL